MARVIWPGRPGFQGFRGQGVSGESDAAVTGLPVIPHGLRTFVGRSGEVVDESYEAFTLPDGSLAPPRAQAAHQQAATVAKSIVRRLEGKPPLRFEYRDFGSLINLSERSAIGRLMGNIFGHETGSVSIEGKLARMAYLSLYKSHQVCVQGWVRTAFLTLANFITRRSKPRLKLH